MKRGCKIPIDEIADFGKLDPKLFACKTPKKIYVALSKMIKDVLVTIVTTICSDNDPTKFYQACGLKPYSVLLDDDDAFPCGYLCKSFYNNSIEDPFYYFVANDNPVIMSIVHGSEICSLGIRFLKAKNIGFNDAEICDGYCIDMTIIKKPLCLEESFCNGYRYGFYCDNNSTYVSNQKFCDNVADCKDKADELLCQNTDIMTCRRDDSDLMFVPIYQFNRCGPIVVINIDPIIFTRMLPYCTNYEDQTNCSDPEKVGMFCKINGSMSSVSRQIICNKYIPRHVSLCDNGLDQLCISPSVSCFVHKHLICDGKLDCPDNSDEKSTICSDMTGIVCKRATVSVGAVTFPLSWVEDGVPDCRSGIDEITTSLPTCGYGKTRRFVTKEESETCQEVYLCENGFVEFTDLCDRIDSCGSENEVCQQTRSIVEAFSFTFKTYKNKSVLTYCLPGFMISMLFGYFCKTFRFQWPNYSVAKRSFAEFVVAPTIPVDCRNVFGKLFVLLSCNSLCKSSDCPLPPVLKHNSCIGQFPNRVFTIGNDSHLTFLIPVTVKGSTMYRQNVFSCQNRRCVEFEKVCDLVDDCGDSSDEKQCNNHFRCEISGELLFWSMVCDGNIDCMDYSDECNEQCSKHIITSGSVRIFAWFMGLIALIFNLVTLPKNLYQLSKCRVARSMSNVLFLILINIGDLLISVYILVVVIFDAIYGQSYCVLRWEWLMSSQCSLIGILSTFGTFISVFSMNFLSVSRFSVIRSALMISSKINKMYLFKVSLIVFMIISAAFIISTVPILSTFDDFFVNGIVYSKNNPLFVGMLNKQKIFKLLREYYGRIRYKLLSWKLMISLISDIFSKDYTVVRPTKLKFFSNDAVCLFKYFVTAEDPQRNYVWTIISLHALSLFIIVLCYIGIWKITKKSSAHLVVNLSQNAHINERNVMMQRKIMMIIGTDTLCWAPFLMLSVLHYSELLDATSYYSIISLIMIPINSVINPVILDDFLSSNLARGTKAVYKLIQSIFASPTERRADIELNSDPGLVISNPSEMNMEITED